VKKQKDNKPNTINLKGKSKKFSLERLTAIMDYLVRLEVGASQEFLKTSVGHSLDYYATFNSLADMNLLKRYVVKRTAEHGESASANRDDLTSTAFKCNFHES
jgi:hypothetical protein